MHIKTNNSTSPKKVILILLLVGLLSVALYGAIAYAQNLPPFTADEKITEQGSNLSMSDAEQDRINELKNNPDQKVVNPQTDTPTTPTADESGKATVNVLLTNARPVNGTIQASGFVTNVVEEGGTCSYVFRNGTNVITKKVDTMTNPTSTTCMSIEFLSSELSSGSWSVTIQYSSSTSKGESNTKDIQV